MGKYYEILWRYLGKQGLMMSKHVSDCSISLVWKHIFRIDHEMSGKVIKLHLH